MMLGSTLFTSATLWLLGKDIRSIIVIINSSEMLLTITRTGELLLWIASTLGFCLLVLARMLNF